MEYLQASSHSQFTAKARVLSEGNPFADSLPDPLCKFNLKETSESVKAFPATNTHGGVFEISAQKRRLEAPSTPGRPFFSFSVGNPSRKSIPSKWDDAEKWLISTSCHESPAHCFKPSSDPSKVFLQRKSEEVANGNGASSEILLKDRLTDNVEVVLPNLRYSHPTKEGFLFNDSCYGPQKNCEKEVASEAPRRDVGTEMTPLGSLTTSRCHTPMKSSSPARHNTPADRSGPLVDYNAGIDISELKDCQIFAKLEFGAQYESVISNWSSREEEEEEVSKSLRHCEINVGRKSVTESRASFWEDEEKAKSCIRYQREEAKIQAWVNLQTAKAEAKSRKLEVKIQKMRSNLEEKLMKRMAIVHRRAEEWRAEAQLQHSQQIIRAAEQAKKMMMMGQRRSHFTHQPSTCGCFLMQQ
ncbi:Uncharacterized protein AXF42_Ash017371 [Apostasia shenzhenica]|uniref:Remorin C-terminal domain-containing protein n=1 Tax=Apostasia shenzhenica TaxID=1088818 RepID=A0A2I0BDK4_9ASPA|nr:Uncharacterized protein AXF42_Ash017371 [Apostasia shenzhenica]